MEGRLFGKPAASCTFSLFGLWGAGNWLHQGLSRWVGSLLLLLSLSPETAWLKRQR
jgi:hypothetical protein